MAVSGGDFFEGTEKLLEIWFSNRKCPTKDCDLRYISRDTWDEILVHVNCWIVSYKKNDSIDSYVLSESSMFVSQDRFILKTCGSTTLLNAIQPVIDAVHRDTGFNHVEDLFYSHKKFIKPEVQKGPHQSFEREAEYLDSMFDNGAAYAMGRLNNECWYLYTLETPLDGGIYKPDQTLELLMTGLDPNVMKLFTKEYCVTAQQATKESGIFEIMPGVVIDDVMFDPCGYSMNGILPDSRYITIHVTPEPECSYVSFESNVPQASYFELATKITNVFRPQQFLMTVFANKASVAKNTHRDLEGLDVFNGFKRLEHQDIVCLEEHPDNRQTSLSRNRSASSSASSVCAISAT